MLHASPIPLPRVRCRVGGKFVNFLAHPLDTAYHVSAEPCLDAILSLSQQKTSMLPTKWAKYGNSYQKAWVKEEELEDWIKPVVGDDDSKAACRFVKIQILAHHAGTDKHKTNVTPFSSMHLTDTGFTESKLQP
ncbi:hypothetical protein KIL84_015058 [Mauremys mutica]|uniref:Uncharacterized protein n=1 Tax=Mauremys mutica TaxID=74926 RepID=A0A9D3XRC3_9SAUR|nr:hypothetical protein KIL84_015058 [Mauremys mutica]